MAKPLLLLVKPVIKAISKKAGIKITNLDAVNLVRAKFDKTIHKAVADSLGISTKRLREITSFIPNTTTRKQAVTGANYIKNVNRFIKDPVKSIKSYTQNYLKSQIKHGIKDLLSNENEDIETENSATYRALLILQGKLNDVGDGLILSQNIWNNVENIDVEDIWEIIDGLAMDGYYNQENNHEKVLAFKGIGGVTDENDKGYGKALLVNEYMARLENMLIHGYHSQPSDY
jgi:hypothetical protein